MGVEENLVEAEAVSSVGRVPAVGSRVLVESAIRVGPAQRFERAEERFFSRPKARDFFVEFRPAGVRVAH